jgi:ComF family protein
MLIDGLLAVVLAPACAACGLPLPEPTRSPVCRTCLDAVLSFASPRCGQCGVTLPSWRVISVASASCARCRRRPGAVRSRAVGPYAGTLRALVHALKYDGYRSLAPVLGRLMRDHGADVIGGADIAVPVPLHRRRARERGFNQADDLARATGLPVVRALRRVRATPSQTDLPAARRYANVRDAFALRRGIDVRGLRILIVDDVCTTGATIEACARVLRQGGAAQVSALTAARVEARPRG